MFKEINKSNICVLLNIFVYTFLVTIMNISYQDSGTSAIGSPYYFYPEGYFDNFYKIGFIILLLLFLLTVSFSFKDKINPYLLPLISVIHGMSFVFYFLNWDYSTSFMILNTVIAIFYISYSVIIFSDIYKNNNYKTL